MKYPELYSDCPWLIKAIEQKNNKVTIDLVCSIPLVFNSYQHEYLTEVDYPYEVMQLSWRVN